MVTIKLPGVNQIRAKQRDGSYRYYYYHRETKTKLPDDPTSIEFISKLKELNDGCQTNQTKPGSIASLAEQYLSSKQFTGLSPKSQKDYRRYVDIIRDNWGDNPVKNITREAVINIRDAFQDTPRTANYLMQILRLMLEFALDRPSIYGLTHNPAARPKQLKTGSGHRPWEEGEIEAFRRHWPAGTFERTAFEIALNTGQRGEDIISMRRQDITSEGIAVTQDKTGARLTVPISIELAAALAAWDTAQHGSATPTLASRRQILVGDRRQAIKVDYFRHRMTEAYAAAGLPGGVGTGCTTHGLRYTAATRLHELGCDWETIAAITGHETVSMVRKYTAQKRRAKVAITRLDQARKNRG